MDTISNVSNVLPVVPLQFRTRLRNTSSTTESCLSLLVEITTLDA
jgi:hypothetical protein